MVAGNFLCGGFTGFTITLFSASYHSIKEFFKVQNATYNNFSIRQILLSLRSLLRLFLGLPLTLFYSFVQRSIYFSLQ